MNRLITTVLLFVTTAAATAQQVSLNPVVVSPLTTLAVLGSAVDVKTANAVPSLRVALVGDGTGNQSGAVSSFQLQDSLGVRKLHFYQSIFVTNSGTQPALAGASADLRLEVAATAPTNVRLEVVVHFSGTAGAPLPSLTIDVGDDGILEQQGVGAAPFTAALPVGTSVFPVRVATATQLMAAGWSTLDVVVTLRPGQSTQITPQISGCADDYVGGNVVVAPDFDGSLTFEIGPPPPMVPVLVLGLGVQPVVLPIALPPILSPCLLLPSPDILVPMAFSPLGWPTVVLPLPPAVRPVTFWAQGVVVDPVGLFSTDAYRIDAL